MGVVLLEGKKEKKLSTTVMVGAIAFVVVVAQATLATRRHSYLGKAFIGGGGKRGGRVEEGGRVEIGWGAKEGGLGRDERRASVSLSS